MKRLGIVAAIAVGAATLFAVMAPANAQEGRGEIDLHGRGVLGAHGTGVVALKGAGDVH